MKRQGISFEEICMSGSTAALMLSSRTVRALYAMQLELDACCLHTQSPFAAFGQMIASGDREIRPGK